MKQWSDWEIIRHHVSICGRVLDTRGKPVPGVHLGIVPHGAKSESQLGTRPASARAKAAIVQQDAAASDVLKRTESHPDGTFFLLDCPDGEYLLKAADNRSGAQAQQIVRANESAITKHMKDRKPNEGYQIELVLK